MSKEIKINFIWSKESAIEASKKYYDYDMRHTSKRYIGWFFIALTQFGIVGALKHDSYAMLYLSTFLVAYWYYGRWYIRKLMIEKFYDKQTTDAVNIHFILKEDGLYNKDNLIPWDQIHKVIQFDDGILIQIENNTLFFKRDAFQSYKDLTSFLERMKEKGKL